MATLGRLRTVATLSPVDTLATLVVRIERGPVPTDMSAPGGASERFLGVIRPIRRNGATLSIILLCVTI